MFGVGVRVCGDDLIVRQLVVRLHMLGEHTSAKHIVAEVSVHNGVNADYLWLIMYILVVS
jgi:hypothetical protein